MANTTVDPDRPGDYNQGLMELGATVCSPKSPQCASCPVRKLCRSNAKVRFNLCRLVVVLKQSLWTSRFIFMRWVSQAELTKYCKNNQKILADFF